MTIAGESSLVDTTLTALKAVLPQREFVPLHEPIFSGNEVCYLQDCIETGWVSSVGAYVDKFEKLLCEFTGAAHAVAVVNGTAGLQLALRVVGVEAGDEVIIPTLSFVATANAVSHIGAIPHFADSGDRTLGLCPLALRWHLEQVASSSRGECFNKVTGRRIRAVVPMHVFGHPVAMDEILEIAREFHLRIVEDAAESLGSMYRGRHTGILGEIGVLSFNGNKTITTGGGGALLTNDAALARHARHLSTTAKVPHRWNFVHDEIGYNFRMPNLNAAVGCAQLERLDHLLSAKRRLFSQYERAFASVQGVRLMTEPEGCLSNYWLQALILEDGDAGLRDALLEATNSGGIQTRPAWSLLHELPMYATTPRMEVPCASRLERSIINIPSSSNLA
jgi:aminotransferase in exopolysaccharide biosynthesis